MTNYIIVIGYPGSGKSTQSKIISQFLNLPVISIKDILKTFFNQNCGLNQIPYRCSTDRIPLDDELISALIIRRLSLPDCSKGAVIDGFPCNLYQALALQQYLDDLEDYLAVVIGINVSFDESFQRLLFREVSEELYLHRVSELLYKSRLVDDQTTFLFDYFFALGMLIMINGSQDIPFVSADILSAVEAITTSDPRPLFAASGVLS